MRCTLSPKLTVIPLPLEPALLNTLLSLVKFVTYEAFQFIFLRFEQLRKASVPILVTPLPIVKDIKLSQL